ncbi:MAG: hypothetical protein V4438_03370 [Patescibacteria group bacterium]
MKDKKLEKDLAKRWSKNGIRPDVFLAYFGLIHLMFSLFPILLVRYWGDPKEHALIQTLIFIILTVLVQDIVWILACGAEIIKYWKAMTLFRKYRLHYYDNIDQLSEAVRKTAAGLHMKIVDHCGMHGIASERLAAEAEFEAFWKVMGEEGFELLSDKKKVESEGEQMHFHMAIT